MEIKILGPGCAKCEQTAKVVKEAVEASGVEAKIEKVTGMLDIASYGVFGTPAVVVDGEVKSVGKVPKKEDVVAWVKQERQGGEKMAKECCTSSGEVMLLACSGGSNMGQLSNAAAVELTQEGFGKMFCLAGIGGNLSGFVQSAKDVPAMVVMDGCSVGCAKAIFEKAGVALRGYVVLTELGIEKNKNLAIGKNDIERVKAAAKQAAALSAGPGGC